jgi:glycerophosphoryl diester phosphodiesterase
MSMSLASALAASALVVTGVNVGDNVGDDVSDNVAVVGHRGAPAELPESTLAGFAVALESAHMIELDVRATKDGVLVVHHDPVARARNGAENVRIRDTTFAALRALDVGAPQHTAHPKQRALPGAQIPSLDEVLALVRSAPPHVRVLIELKADDAPAPAALARLVVDTLDRSRARHRVIVESFEPALIRALRERAPNIARGLLCGTCDARALLVAEELDARIVSPAHDRIDRAFVDAAHARGLGVYAWTANDTASWTRLRALGVDAIVTDDPRALNAELP